MLNDYLVLGGSGLVGKGIVSALRKNNLEFRAPSSTELNLLDINGLDKYISDSPPKCIIMAAGKVGGIKFNKDNQISQFLLNLALNLNVLEIAAKYKIENFCLVSSSCIYPLNASVPLHENDLFNGLPEPTNEGYANAKSASLRLLNVYKKSHFQNWFAVIPTNVIGPKNNISDDGHVFDAVVRKIGQAIKNNADEVTFWGTGNPIRQFIHTFDLGEAIVQLTHNTQNPVYINISTPESYSIKQLVVLVKRELGYHGKISFDSKMPDGHMDKTLDTSILRNLIDWQPKQTIEKAIVDTYSTLIY